MPPVRVTLQSLLAMDASKSVLQSQSRKRLRRDRILRGYHLARLCFQLAARRHRRQATWPFNDYRVLLKNSARSRPQGRNGDKPSKWVRKHCAVTED